MVKVICYLSIHDKVAIWTKIPYIKRVINSVNNKVRVLLNVHGTPSNRGEYFKIPHPTSMAK